MPSDRAKIEATKSYFRRKYAGNLEQLKDYAESVFHAATDSVEITSISAEGAQTGGQLVFEKSLLLIMVEELIQELDPAFTLPAAIPRGRPLGVTVRLGC